MVQIDHGLAADGEIGASGNKGTPQNRPADLGPHNPTDNGFLSRLQG